MRNRFVWILVAALALFAVPDSPRWIGLDGPTSGGMAGVAAAQEVMKFEPVPEESVAAAEQRRVERIAQEAERRAARALERRPGSAPPIPPVPGVPPVPDVRHASDIVRIGSDIHVPKGQVVDGDVFALRGDIRVDGHVRGNVAATGGDVFLGSTARVDGDVMCIGGKLEEEEGARVGGQRVTALRGNGRRDRIERIVVPGHRDWEPRHDYGDLSFALSWLMVSLLLAWAIAKFAPARTTTTIGVLRRDPGLSLMVGLGLVVLLVPSVVALALVVAILCITIIGIPLALGAIVAYAGILVVLALWGYVIGVIPIGEQFGKRLDRPASLVTSAVLGVAVVSGLRVASELFQFVPLFGWFGKLLWVVAFLVASVATLMGAGALLRTKFGQGPEGRWWPLWGTARAPSQTAARATEGGTPPAPPPPPAPADGSGEPSPVT